MTGDENSTVKEQARSVWALGDYARVADDVLAGLGDRLVEACGIKARHRVLDVATGTGGAALPAAARGASVVASDLTPELLDAGRRRALERGLELEWVEADAEQLPFEDGEFDVVMSCIGAMFAPDHQRTADELLRVCKPGGTIGLINWAADGSIARFFEVFAPYAPPSPAGAQSPMLWGSAEHVELLFGNRVSHLDMMAGDLVVEHFADKEDFCAYYKANFGPAIATYADIADDPERVAALDRDFLDYAARANVSPTAPSPTYVFDYVVVLARKKES
ncbi:2-polyprenyl-6-hydroxyphenyl methylase / 3-demethylubiquinone-9 3-methyltransferase [Amycolatopsis marina]|uniref:2-polyprenyl-6-hydroxyphenyl methylase / 3-demethylubiquinone-9 3-methyltransferase n=1 Tax=Amycolatopsis marina TaxID=490629 RepID=A0A1I0W3G1_9PSEU|nr:class I SAM-dependent methyltransferase [Amycolatopsis marina]SFA83141.1 2-polyprenyl-6-hydroxyphenyl methylase / 3-demethylubiquinone-9 3-methyltransferase [Amycolatopsis marina]